MIRTLTSLAVVGGYLMVVQPALAAKVLDTQVGKFDLDPFNVLAPAEPPAPAAPATPAPAPKKHHHKHHKMKK